MRLKNDRLRKVLTKEILVDITVSEVKSELIAMGYERHWVSQVKNFKTKLPILIDVFRNDNLKNIFESINFLDLFVRVEIHRFKCSNNAITANCSTTVQNFIPYSQFVSNASKCYKLIWYTGRFHVYLCTFYNSKSTYPK